MDDGEPQSLQPLREHRFFDNKFCEKLNKWNSSPLHRGSKGLSHEFDEEIEKIKEKKLKELLKSPEKGNVIRKGNIVNLDFASFKSLLKSESRPILVDFWAEWCGPCRMLAPIFEKLSEKYSDKVVFAKVNVDECPDLAEEYGVMAVPTLILFANGIEVERIIGLVPEKRIESLIKKYLK
ncbi:MAG: thioredoxin [Candidatus Verstraetearchaeota archaeon]|nr:thioredoxin [Candidatus Verstraetearchaeota archaeon]